jgi:hypothetical protein
MLWFTIHQHWRKYNIKAIALLPIGASFYAHVFHPSYTLEPDDCKEAGERFAQHIGAVESSMRWLRDVFGRVRASRAGEI